MEAELWPNKVGLSRAYLAREIEKSLGRLGTDYIDLYQLHLPDFYTPLEETMRVLDDFVKAGKIRYAGASNFDGWHVVKANDFARQFGLTPLISNQIWYNLADRVAENSIVPACKDAGVSIVSWGALAIGFLTGRSRRGDKGPIPGSRLEREARDSSPALWGCLATDRGWDTLDVLDRVAREHGSAVANVGMQYLLQSGNCDVVLLGAGRIEHFRENMKTAGLRLAEDEVQELELVSRPEPTYPVNFYRHLGFKGQPDYGMA